MSNFCDQFITNCCKFFVFFYLLVYRPLEGRGLCLCLLEDGRQASDLGILRSGQILDLLVGFVQRLFGVFFQAFKFLFRFLQLGRIAVEIFLELVLVVLEAFHHLLCALVLAVDVGKCGLDVAKVVKCLNRKTFTG